MSAPPPRVRVAPSPTGDPHVGTAYIALFNMAFARRHGGKFVLRIEDTDRERSSQSSEQAIYAALSWLGLEWDEGPDVGGPHGPYRQSERAAIYREHIDRLLASGAAYRCFCTRERLDALRKEQMARKRDPGYDGHCRGLDPAVAASRAESGEAHVVRLAVPEAGETGFEDLLRGEIRIANERVDDQVLLKSDGFPTYHLAVVVDDHLMGITHVIRGEEWITSTPKHVILYRAFGWDLPVYCHVGLLRNADKSKLSKRKNPVSIFHYRALGYMPQTFLNFLATLGFSLGDGRERFTLDELIAGFELTKLSAGGPVFDPQKLDAFSGDDIRALDPSDLLQRIREHALGPTRLEGLVALSRERITRLDDFVPYVSMFYGATVDYSYALPKMKVKKRTHAECVDVLRRFVEELEQDAAARAFTADALEPFARAFCERHGWKPRDLFTLLRVGATGRLAAPPLFDTLAALGKDRVRLRLRDFIAVLRQSPAAAS